MAASLLGQGLTTTATKDDWEEINFEFNSSILSDGYPSLLRLADLLNKFSDFRVTLEGNTDWVGSDAYNNKLSEARAQTVKNFLVKYGANPSQISIEAQGKRSPKVDNKTPEGRFMNRRVTITVTDAQGKVLSEGGIREAIRALEKPPAPPQPGCCDEILKKLDKLDDILAAIRDLKSEYDKLKQEVAGLQKAQAGVEQQVREMPKPPTAGEMARMMETTAEKAIDQAKPNRFSLLGLNLGPVLSEPGRGNLTFTGRGRYFAPFGKDETHAVQAEGEYLYYPDRQEGQMDLGLVNRYKNMQAGLFSSFKHAHIRNLGGGTLGQAALTMDYLFSHGRVGMFGTKAFLNDRVISRRPFQVSPDLMSFNVWEEHYLRVVDQIGGSATLAAWQGAYFDASLGALFRRGGGNRPGGMIRLVQPITDRVAFTAEAGLNETLLGAGNTGRLVFGIQLGNWLRPKEYTQVTHAVPVEVPRVRYEVLSRKVRTGNAPPVADAGPDQIGVAAGAITLNGTGSFDPDGDPITYQWEQIAGPTVSISGMNTATARFTAAEGQTYSFRLRVKDDQGAQGTARTTVTTAAPLAVRIVRFTAAPTTIRSGQSSVLSWQVQNAETVEITSLGQVDPRSGTSSVSPTQTTTYRLTAKNRTSEVSESLTVVVEQPQVRILSFQSSPANVAAGQSSTLIWHTENAETASISGLGDVGVSGTAPVTPSASTTYTLTARNRYGEVTATATVQVTPVPVPRIVTFFAAPAQILAGEQSTLVWQVENAAKVEISSIGPVSSASSQEVSPNATTTYTLTASNASGQVAATATVTVLGPVEITSFTASPTTVNSGEAATLTWTTKNATSAWISGVGHVPVNGSVKVNPTTTTTYTLIVTGNRTQAQAAVTVQVRAVSPPFCDAGVNQTTQSEFIRLDASGSKDPAGGPLAFSWRVSGSKPAEIFGADTATPRVTFQQGWGEYIFEVTVTNSAGLRCTASTRVNYIDP